MAWVLAGGGGLGTPEPAGLLERRGSPQDAPALSGGGLSAQRRNRPCVRCGSLSRTSSVQTLETCLPWAGACGCFSAAWLTAAAACMGPGDPREQHRPSGPDQQHGLLWARLSPLSTGSLGSASESHSHEPRPRALHQHSFVLAFSITIRSVDAESEPWGQPGHGALGPRRPDGPPGPACGQTVRLSISHVAAKRQSALES